MLLEDRYQPEARKLIYKDLLNIHDDFIATRSKGTYKSEFRSLIKFVVGFSLPSIWFVTLFQKTKASSCCGAQSKTHTMTR